jgi:hypothetical protein
VLLSSAFSATASAEVRADDPDVLRPFLQKSTTWRFPTLEADVPVNIYFRGNKSTPAQQAPVLVRVKGVAPHPIGLESDESILTDYLGQGYIVITVDLGGNWRPVSPAIDWDLHSLLRDLDPEKPTKRGSRLLSGLTLRAIPKRVFCLPIGYRMATDLAFWDMHKHGSPGTMDRVVDVYNQQVVDEKGRHHIPGRPRISSPEELIDRSGNPLDCRLLMDIIYPSKPRKSVPLVFLGSTKTVRAPSQSDVPRRPHAIGFVLRGYAFAIIDHCWNPVALHYGYFNGAYSLDSRNGLRSATASVRYIRAHADRYHIDPRYIGGIGHSKAALAVTRLSNPDHESRMRGSVPLQPRLGFSSRISVGYQSMGNGTRASSKYVTPNYTPTIVACGEKDHFNHWGDWPDVLKAYGKADPAYIALGMLGLGHELPYGRDRELDIDRYEVMVTFFDHYLRADSKLPPAILWVTPADTSRGVPPTSTIVVQCAPAMDVESIASGVSVMRLHDGNPVKGVWQTSRKGTRFTFTPERPLRASARYGVVVTTGVRNHLGVPLDEEETVQFQVRGEATE